MRVCACGRAIQPAYWSENACEDCWVSTNHRYWPTQRPRYLHLQPREPIKTKQKRIPHSLRELLE